MPARPTRTVSTPFWFRPELTPQRLPTQTATARAARLPILPSPSPAVARRPKISQMVGGSNLEENSVAIDDTKSGNSNDIINSNECVNLNVALKNNGCANATRISATLTTTTPGVTVNKATRIILTWSLTRLARIRRHSRSRRPPVSHAERV